MTKPNERGCTCQPKDRASWRVVQYHCNFSAFSGYHYTPSAYSMIRCQACGAAWRTKAAYVEELTGQPATRGPSAAAGAPHTVRAGR